MKKILSILSLTVCIALASCKTGQTVQTDELNGTYGVAVTSSSVTAPDTLDNYKIDSLLRVDRLPAIHKWASSVYIDDENGKASQYRTLYDRSTNTIYTLKTLADQRFVLIKRIIKTR